MAVVVQQNNIQRYSTSLCWRDYSWVITTNNNIANFYRAPFYAKGHSRGTRGTQRALKGHKGHSRSIKRALKGQKGHSRGTNGVQGALKGHNGYSRSTKGTQGALKGHSRGTRGTQGAQWALKGNLMGTRGTQRALKGHSRGTNGTQGALRGYWGHTKPRVRGLQWGRRAIWEHEIRDAGCGIRDTGSRVTMHVSFALQLSTTVYPTKHVKHVCYSRLRNLHL